MKAIVIGLGVFGRSTSVALARYGVEVIAMDTDMAAVEAVQDDVALAVCVDASSTEALEEHDVASADLLVAAIGSDFEAQILTVVHARDLGVKRIVARALTEDHLSVLRAVGAHEVLNPEQEAARLMVQRLVIPDISSYFELSDGFSIVEVRAPSGMVGMSLRDLDLSNRFRVNVVAIKEMGLDDVGRSVAVEVNAVPGADTVIKETDVLALAGSDLHIAKLMSEGKE